MSKVFKAIGNAVSGVVKAVVGVVKAVVGVVSSVVNFLVQPFMGLLGGMPGMPNAGQEAQRQDGVLVQRQGSNVNIPVVYGMRRVGGAVTFAETGSNNNQYLWVAYVLSEGLVEGLRDLYIDDYQIEEKYINQLMAGEGNIVQIGDGKYKDRVQLQFFPGTYYSDPATDSVIPSRTLMKDSPNWKDTMYYNGLAVLFARYYWKKVETQADADANPFSGGIPGIKATLLGRKVASLVTSASESVDYEGAGYVERYSTNPAEILLDYLRNPRYGKGLVNSDIDWASWRTAAAKCNQQVEYVTGVFGPIMTCNFVLDTAQSIFANVKTLLMGFRGYMPYIQGRYKLKIEDAGDPTDILSGVATIAATFNQDNIQGDVKFTGIDKGAKYTSVAVTYVDPDNKYSTQQVIYPETEEERQTYIDLDGGRENKLEATFPTITNYAIAKDFARMLFNKSRRQESCTLTVSSQAIELEPGDMIRVQSNILDFGTDPWRIVSFKLNDDLTVELACVRNPDDIYPHTRVGEEDIVLPVFVPKGATIYYPTSQNGPGVGLIPPTHVPGYNETNPNTSIGGGVGNPNEGPNGQPNPPPVVEVPLELTDRIKITYAKYRSVSGNQLTATIEFTQPENAMYESVDIWYKGKTDLGYKKVTVTDKPGANQKITADLPEIISQRTYYGVARVNYSTGEKSQIITNFTLLGPLAGTGEFPTDDEQIVQSGWELPIYTTEYTRNNMFGTIYALATGGGSGVARTLSFSVLEKVRDIVGAEAPNPDIAGVYVFWRQSGTEYWQEKAYLFQPEYTPGDYGTFTFDGDIGLGGDVVVNYDFVCRYYYKDGKQSTRQRRFMGVDVTANPSHGFGVLIASEIFTEDSGSYEIQRLADNPGAVLDPKDITVGLKYVFCRNGLLGAGDKPTVRFGIIPTEASNLVYFRGLRIYYRKYDPFSREAQAWLSVTSLNQTEDADGLLSLAVNLPDFNYEYEWLVVPLVRSGTSTIEADQCWSLYGQPYSYSASFTGSLPIGVPTQTFTSTVYSTQRNYKDQWQPKLVNTYEARNTIQTIKAQVNPTVQVLEWRVINSNAGNTWWNLNGVNYIGSYYRLKVNVGHIGVSYSRIRIYRRNRYQGSTPLITQSTDVNRGLGRWEYIDESTAPDGSGNITVLLRSPIHFYEYNSDGTLNTLYTGTRLGKPIAAPNSSDEFLVVIYQDTGSGAFASPVGILLKGGVPTLASSVEDLLTPTINGTVPPTVTLADYESAASGYNRRLTEARASVAASNLTVEQIFYPYNRHLNGYIKDVKGLNISLITGLK